MKTWTPEMIDAVERAAKENPQIREAVIGGRAAPDVLREFLAGC